MTASLRRALVRALFFVAILACTAPLLAQSAVDGPPFSADPKDLLAAARKADAKGEVTGRTGLLWGLNRVAPFQWTVYLLGF